MIKLNIINFMNLSISLSRLIIILLIFYSGNVSARMYQWTDDETGTTQLSGKPPTWYRSADGGPRVFVFDKGHLIDDTAVEVSDEIRDQMRVRAFVMVEEDKLLAKEKMLKAKELEAKFKQDKPEQTISDAEQLRELELLQKENALVEDTLEQDDEAQSEEELLPDQLRDLISKWEKSQTESAKQVLE